MATLSHLDDSMLSILSESDELRIERIEGYRWIGYPRAKAILNKMDKLLHRKKKSRMPGMLLYGESNSGKSSILERFLKLNPVNTNEEEDFIDYPVMLFRCPPGPDVHLLYNRILDRLSGPYRPNDSPATKLNNIINLLSKINLKLLILDEIQDLLAGSHNKITLFLNTLKYLSAELKIPIVIAGIETSKRVIATDDQLINRFKPVRVPTWQYDQSFLQLLSSFERLIPLKSASNLYEEEISVKLFQMSEGLIGELDEILVEASTEAIVSGQERITVKILNELDWMSPSERRTDDSDIII